MDKFSSLGKESLGKGKDLLKGGLSKFKTANPRDQTKFQFDIQILKVDSLAAGSGPVYVSWKRGSKSSNNGKTKLCQVVGKTANINHPVQIITTLQKEKPPKKTYEDKNISISIKEEKGKKGTTLGKTILNLAEYSSPGNQFKLIPIKVKKGSSLSLSLNITTKELEMDPDGEPMTETDMNSNDGSDDEEEGEDFQDDDLTPSDVSSNHSSNTSVGGLFKKTSDSNSSTPSKSTFARTNSDLNQAGNRTSTNIDYSAATAGITDEKHKAELNSLLGKPSSSTASSTPNKSNYSSPSSTTSSLFKKTPENTSNSNLLSEDERHKADLNSLLSNTPPTKSTSSDYNSYSNNVNNYNDSPSSANGLTEKRLKKENEDQKKRISDLEKQVSDLQKQKGGSSSSGGSISKQDIMNSAEYIELKNRFKEVAGENVDMEDKIKELEAKLSSSKPGTTSPTSHNVTSLPKDLKAIADLQDNLKQKNARISELDNRVRDLENELHQELQNDDKNREIESLKNEIQTLKLNQNNSNSSASSLSMVGGGTLELKRKIQDLTKEVKDRDDTIKQLRSGGSSATSTTNNNNNSAQIKQLENQIQELERTNSNQKQEIDKLKQEISMKKSVSPTMNTNSNEINDLKNRIQILESDNRELSSELEERSQQFKYREDQLNNKISDLQDQKEQLESKMSVSLASASSLSFNSNKNQSNQGKQEFKAEKEKLEKQLESVNTELQKERDRSKKLQRELTEQNNRVRDLENQLLNSGSPNGGSVAKTDLQEREENRIIEQCIYTQSFTYSDGIGAVALSLYQKLTDQNTFSQENSRLFNKVINGLTQSVEKSMYNSADLAFWLSNTSRLINLIKEGPNNINDGSDRDPLIDGILIDQNTASPNTSSRRSPSLTFYYQLESLSRECYSLLLHNIYKKLEPKLSSILSSNSCILDKKTHRISSTMSHTQDIQKICKILGKYLNSLKDNFVFDSIIQQFFSQTFFYISYNLLNQIIEGSSPNACSPSSGFKIKLSISMIEDWIASCGEDRDLLLPTKEYFSVIIEASNLMVIDKSIFTDAEAILSAFTTLNILQIKKLLEIWRPDQLSPDPIPSSVLTMAKGNWNRPTNNLSLLLDPTILINVVPQL